MSIAERDDEFNSQIEIVDNTLTDFEYLEGNDPLMKEIESSSNYSHRPQMHEEGTYLLPAATHCG